MTHSIASAELVSFRTSEAYFSKTDDYLDTLVSIQIGGDGLRSLSFPRKGCDAKSFADAGAFVAKAEASMPGPSLNSLLFAVGSDPAKLHPLTWLNVSERKSCDERRSGHEWYLTLDDGPLWLTFEHGKFGYRRESFERWSAAFSRLAEILAGECSWKQFGDVDSQNTMLGKGQFYWSDVAAGEDIPVDNFVFVMDEGMELKLEGVSNRCVVNLDGPSGAAAFEWHEDYATALLRMADVLDGSVTFAEFGTGPDAFRPEAAGCILKSVPLTGRFVVKSIYANQDVHPAPVLVYKTGEGHRAILETRTAEWSVTIGGLHQECRTRKFSPEQTPEALRTLARVLTGSIQLDNL